jgi:hypothetical protein
MRQIDRFKRKFTERTPQKSTMGFFPVASQDACAPVEYQDLISSIPNFSLIKETPSLMHVFLNFLYVLFIDLVIGTPAGHNEDLTGIALAGEHICDVVPI